MNIVISDSNMFLFQFTFRDSGTLDDTKIITIQVCWLCNQNA
jgi:hypothetical protein